MMTNTKPMSESLSRLIEEAKASVAAMTPDERAAMYSAQRYSWVRGEMGIGSDADEAAYAKALRDGDTDAMARLREAADARMAAFDGLQEQPR